MKYPVTPVRPEPGNKALTILRIFLWLMPAIFIPVSVVIAFVFFDVFHSSDLNTTVLFCGLAVIIASAAVGYFDRRIALMQKKIAPPHSKKDLARCTILFVLAQIIIAPVLCYMVIYGYCVVTGIA